MAHLPPSAVFGALLPGQAVHVLLLIENSLPMVEHREDLQHQVLPGLLGAVRVANPGGNVQIFWETTGKTQEQHATQKDQRHFNDFPNIDIVGLPQNKLSPLFVRQSVDLFLLNNAESARSPATRHLVIVAMSDPVDDNPGTSDNALGDSQVTWEFVAEKLQNNRIIVHVVANPAARMTRIFDLFRKTLRSQLRQEVIPWQSSDSSRCICHLSGAAMKSKDQGWSSPQDEWPEISPTTNDPYDLAVAASYQSQYTTNAGPVYMAPPAYPPDLQTTTHSLNHQAGQHTQNSVVPLVDPSTNEPMTVGGPVSLVSRMQALHGLAKRRPERERARAAHTSFFREPEPPRPGGNPAGGVERTERPRPRHNIATSPLGSRPTLPATTGGSRDGRHAGNGSSRAKAGTGPTSPERRGGRRARAGSRSSTTATMSPTTAFTLPPSSPSSDGSPGSTPSPMWPATGISAAPTANVQSTLSHPGPPSGFSSSVNANAVPLTEYGLRRYSSNTQMNSSTGQEYGMGMNMAMVVPSQSQGGHMYSQTIDQQTSYTHSHPSMSMPNTPLASTGNIGGSTSMSVPATPYSDSETASMSSRDGGHGNVPPLYHTPSLTMPHPSSSSSYSAPATGSTFNQTNYFSLPYSSSSEPTSGASMSNLPGITRTAMNLHLSMPMSSTLPVSPSGELEVVPASAPLDPAGEVPFIMDEEAEKRAEIKLERALKAMREEAHVKNNVSAATVAVNGTMNTYPSVKMNVGGGGGVAMSEAGSLSPTRTQASSSSSFSLPNSPISQISPNATYDQTQAYKGLSYSSTS